VLIGNYTNMMRKDGRSLSGKNILSRG